MTTTTSTSVNGAAGAHAHPHHGHAHGGHGHGEAADPNATSSKLKAATAAQHAAAERHEYQRALFKGALPRESYVDYLQQMLCVHEALETALCACMDGGSAPVKAVVTREQLQAPYLREDLRHFGVEAERVAPTAGTAAMVERIGQAAGDGVALLGFHYVLEGSNNGSKYIAVNVRKAYGLTAGAGDRYLDPYGERQMQVWKKFKADLDAVELGEAERERLIGAAGEMFDAIYGISDDLWARSGLKQG